MNRKTLLARHRKVETAFHAFDAAFPILTARATKDGQDADRDTLFRTHALLRAALRESDEQLEVLAKKLGAT